MSNKRRNKTKGPPFIQLFRWVTASAAWKVLTPAERVLYLELRARFNGHNNGTIGLGCREAAEAMNVGRDTANRAFARLADLGFIEPTTLGQFRTNGRRATEWLLTELPDDRTGHKPLKTFMSWRAETAAGRKKASPISSHLSPTSRTQTENRVDEMTLRPMPGTQRAVSAGFASDAKDTSRSTTPGGHDGGGERLAPRPPQAASKQAVPAQVHQSEPVPIHVTDALRDSLARLGQGREVVNG